MTEAIQTIENIVSVNDGKAVTDSLTLAKVFGKNHQHTLRDIEALEIPEEWRSSNFGQAQIERRTPTGGVYYDKIYTMTKNGFYLLAMGYTGKKAMQFKLAYIDAFDRMEAMLNGKMTPEQEVKSVLQEYGPEWVLKRIRQSEEYERFYKPIHKIGERNLAGYQYSTIRRASNPVRGGRVPSKRDMAFLTSPNLFIHALLCSLKNQIGEKQP